MKRLLNIAITLAMLFGMAGCVNDELVSDTHSLATPESSSDILVNMDLQIPDHFKVTSRYGVVSEAMETVTLVCFDENGYALSSIPCAYSEDTDLEAKVPSATRIIHVVANQSVSLIDGLDTEAEVMNSLKTASDKMVYWARIQVPDSINGASAVKEWWAESRAITMLRNMAKVSVVNNSDKFILDGFTVVKTKSTGYAVTVDNGAYPTNASKSFNLNHWADADFIHATEDGLVSGTEDSLALDDVFVYETPDSESASIIIKGRNASKPDDVKFWRVAFADDEGNQLNIRRNHHYTVNIGGEIMYGDTSFEAAVDNPTVANSAWMNIAPEVTAIKNSNFAMTVSETTIMKVYGNDTVKVGFSIEQLGDAPFDQRELSVVWEKGILLPEAEKQIKKISYSKKDTLVNGKICFNGKIEFPLAHLQADTVQLEDYIIINYKKNNLQPLQRKVKVVILPEQKFTIVSYNDSTNYKTVANNDTLYFEVPFERDAYGADYVVNGVPIDKLRFSLPSKYPAELFPFNVLVSTTDFNVVNSPLIFEGDGGYGKVNGIGYKYVYPVSQAVNASKQPIVYEIKLRYLQNLVSDLPVVVKLEAENFAPLIVKVNYKKSEK